MITIEDAKMHTKEIKQLLRKVKNSRWDEEANSVLDIMRELVNTMDINNPQQTTKIIELSSEIMALINHFRRLQELLIDIIEKQATYTIKMTTGKEDFENGKN